jgi:hypothetical protein
MTFSIISQTVDKYNGDDYPNIKIGNHEYRKVMMVDTRKYSDGINPPETIKTMNGEFSNYVVFLDDKDKIVRSIERYRFPKEQMIGNKKYTDIVSKTDVIGKYTSYEIIKGASRDVISVYSDGSVVDENKKLNDLFLKKITKPFKKLISKFIK